jgi:hypothetical protein
MYSEFMGREFIYWAELQRNVDTDKEELLVENARLRTKVSFYEDRLKSMTEFMDRMASAKLF